MDWFRWHHGCVNDPKFQLVAKKSGASVAEVVAVWACLLESASCAENRGDPGAPDFEAMECALGLADGLARRVYEHMRTRELIDPETGRIAAWEKRQPKREREDDNSTERSRAHRAKQRQATPSNAGHSQETPRGEERREEEIPSDEGRGVTPTLVTPAASVCRALRKAGIQAVNPSHPTLLALLEAGASEAEFLGAVAKAKSKRDAFEYVLGVVKGRRLDAAETASGLHRGAMPKDRKTVQLETAALMTGTAKQSETIDVKPRALIA